MDRTAWIAVTLCVIGLVLWEVYSVKQIQPRPRVTTEQTGSPAPDITPPPATTPEIAASASPEAAAPPQPTPIAPAFPEKTEILRNSDLELYLSNRGGGITKAVLLNHVAEENKRVTLNSEQRLPIGAMVENPATAVLPEYKMTRDGDGVACEFVTPEQLTIRKKFFFPPSTEKKDNYLAELDIDLRNGGSAAYTKPGYFVTLGSAAPIHTKDYPSYTRLVWCVDGKAKGIDVSWFAGGGGILGVGARAPQPFYQENVAGADWVAVADQFFTTLVAPLNGKATSVWGRRFEVTRAPEVKMAGIEGALGMPALKIEPGQTYSARFEIYAGPKLYHRLATLSHNEAEVMEFGIFKIVCQALLNALNSLHSILGNYAAAILALTVIVKAILWPIQNKANRSMRQMAALSPKIQELRDKYKDDPTKMNQEVMKLYKQYGINPVGGCLPMVIQIPIFFGLFTMLRQAVELRNSSFLWIKDLSQPDTVAHLPGFGFPINVLPILMAGTNIWMMRLTPKSGDPTQQRMMMFMPIIFVVFCYNFAAALALYYTTQNLLTILQLYHNRKQPMPTLEKVPVDKRKR
ncbi:MAG: YidC/Oxa1 family rane protein insertase [Verrucomicrobiota bacterium]|jgi:YidC/Oxa1 family membrane protein insertase